MIKFTIGVFAEHRPRSIKWRAYRYFNMTWDGFFKRYIVEAKDLKTAKTIAIEKAKALHLKENKR